MPDLEDDVFDDGSSPEDYEGLFDLDEDLFEDEEEFIDGEE